MDGIPSGLRFIYDKEMIPKEDRGLRDIDMEQEVTSVSIKAETKGE